jgi:tetratricopeptide (TPR) repeat protein
MILKNSLLLSFLSIFIYLNGSAQVVSKESVLEQGLNYIKVGKLKEAIGAFKQSIQSEGENPPVLFYLGNAYFDQSHYDSAHYFFSRVLKLDPNHKGALFNSANVLVQMNKSKESLPFYSQLIEMDAFAMESYFGRAKVHAQLGNTKLALSDFENTIKLNPSNDRAYFEIGNLYFGTNDFQNAVEAYDKAIKVNPVQSHYYFNRAIAEYNLGYKEDACADFLNAKDLGDSEAEAYSNELCH